MPELVFFLMDCCTVLDSFICFGVPFVAIFWCGMCLNLYCILTDVSFIECILLLQAVLSPFLSRTAG